LIPTSVATAGSAFSSSSGGSAAAGTLALAVVSSGQLSGNYSGSLASSAASTAGDMLVSSAFYIDLEDKAKVMQVKFYYEASSGATNLSFAGTSSNSFAVWIYDVTNAAWIQPAGVYNLTQSSGVGYCTATFQTTSNSTQYQLALININASSGAYTLYVDDFSVGPQTAPSGPAMSDWTPSTAVIPNAVGFGTVTSPNYYQRRVGDSLEVTMSWVNGTVASSTAFITLSGVSIDSSKLPSNASGTVVGTGTLMITGAARGMFTSNDAFYVFYDGSTTNSVFVTGEDGSSSLVKQNVSAMFGSSQAVTLTFRIPIAGWSSNSVASSDTDTRVIAAQVSGTPASVGTNSPIIFPTVNSDSSSSYNSSTGVYTCPVSGIYTVQCALQSNDGPSIINLYKNGSSYGPMGFIESNAPYTGVGSIDVKCNAGDTLSINPVASQTPSGNCTASFRRLSGPAVITATDSVGCAYHSTAGNTLGNTSTVVYVDFPTKEFDTTGSVQGAGSGNVTTSGTGWRFIAPVSGSYQVNSAVSMVAASGTGSPSEITSRIYVNGTLTRRGDNTSYSINNGTVVRQVSDIVRLVAGDRIEIAFFQTYTNSISQSSNSYDNRVSIYRIGN
jgi:hypothetical protein